MTTNDKKIKDNIEVMDSTELLMEEAKKAALAEEQAAERERINTKLCYERALSIFYEEEGINPEEEKTLKELEEQRQKELDEMSFKEEIKYSINKFAEDMKDPIRKKIRIGQMGRIIISIFRALILFGLCFVIFMPIIEKLSYALRSHEDIGNAQVIWIPENWSIMNVQIAYELITKPGNTYLNSIFLALVTTVIQVIATAIPGYAFARLKFKGSNIFFYLVIASLAIPNEALEIARSIFFTNTGFFGYNLLGSVLAIPVMSIFGSGVRSAIFIFLFRQTFRNLPIELEESAEIDGASVLRTFWSVMLPNARGTIVTVALFACVWQYNDYYFANLFAYQNNMPLLTTTLAGSSESLNSVLATAFPELYKQIGGEADTKFFELIAQTSALLMMVPILVAYLFVQKLFVESVERSGITGM